MLLSKKGPAPGTGDQAANQHCSLYDRTTPNLIPSLSRSCQYLNLNFSRKKGPLKTSPAKPPKSHSPPNPPP